jgi:hypothetical protein
MPDAGLISILYARRRARQLRGCEKELAVRSS